LSDSLPFADFESANRIILGGWGHPLADWIEGELTALRAGGRLAAPAFERFHRREERRSKSALKKVEIGLEAQGTKLYPTLLVVGDGGMNDATHFHVSTSIDLEQRETA